MLGMKPYDKFNENVGVKISIPNWISTTYRSNIDMQ